MTAYDALRQRLLAQRGTWLVTGVAGFIGSHPLETLLKLNRIEHSRLPLPVRNGK